MIEISRVRIDNGIQRYRMKVLEDSLPVDFVIQRFSGPKPSREWKVAFARKTIEALEKYCQRESK